MKMRVWGFCENAYPEAWHPDLKSLRNNLPSRNMDPVKAADILHRHLDEWAMLDELGMDICINEHHSTATCLNASCTLPLSILARETKKARLMSLGIHIANRPDPIRVAEEVALIDVYSRGRFEMGFVKASPYEVFPANAQPVGQQRRFFEAYDLICKALTSHDGPFSWEGEFFHYRDVNVWPRPYQQPMPPSWFVSMSPNGGGWIADRNAGVGTFLSGRSSKLLFDSYRRRAIEIGRPAGPEKLAYLAIVAVADTDEEAKRRAWEILGYVRTSPIVAKQFVNPPGYVSVEDNARALRTSIIPGYVPTYATMMLNDGTRIPQATATVDQLIDAMAVFAGTPDKVFEQLQAYNNYVGGCGNLLMMGQGGNLSHADTVDNYRLFAKHVLPRLQDLEVTPSHDAMSLAAAQ